MICATTLKLLVRYEPESGLLFWLPRDAVSGRGVYDISPGRIHGWNAKYAFRRAFCCNDGKGYLAGTVLNRRMKAHKVAWALYHGRFPALQIDHINGNKHDNRICNLREANNSLNQLNRPDYVARRKLGLSGVYWNAQRGKWQARPTLPRIGRVHVGLFNTKSEAIEACMAARHAL